MTSETKRWRASATGRREGAIGVFYALPEIIVSATTREQAEEAARTEYYRAGYEHVGVSVRPLP